MTQLQPLDESQFEDFDYEITNANYSKALSELPPFRQKLQFNMTRKHFMSYVKDLMLCEQNAQAGTSCSKLTGHTCHHQLELHREDGKIYLIKRRMYPNDSIIKVLTIEDSFDVLSNIHISNGHCTGDYMRKCVRRQYQISNRYINMLVESCNFCTSRRAITSKLINSISPDKRIVTLKNKRFLIDIIFNIAPDGKFTELLCCKELNTSHMFLRPLICECYKEVATELIKIVTGFGSPSFTIFTRPHLNEFFLAAVETMKKFGLNCVITVQTYVNKEPIRSEGMITSVKKHLEKWMNETGTSNWGIGCYVVQWRLNNRFLHQLNDDCKADCDGVQEKRTPYHCTFGQAPKFGPKAVVYESDDQGCDVEEVLQHKNETVKYTMDLIQDYLMKGNGNSKDKTENVIINLI